jgi:hypothetical protein
LPSWNFDTLRGGESVFFGLEVIVNSWNIGGTLTLRFQAWNGIDMQQYSTVRKIRR